MAKSWETKATPAQLETIRAWMLSRTSTFGFAQAVAANSSEATKGFDIYRGCDRMLQTLRREGLLEQTGKRGEWRVKAATSQNDTEEKQATSS